MDSKTFETNNIGVVYSVWVNDEIMFYDIKWFDKQDDADRFFDERKELESYVIMFKGAKLYDSREH
ncbi:hypothetical protein C4577_06575 [Candidatus Parcubacteria bacterium]|nr:MAG: hypothetical protein C4577_06575 [Candidatus Parcubacteria bacterium]